MMNKNNTSSSSSAQEQIMALDHLKSMVRQECLAYRIPTEHLQQATSQGSLPEITMYLTWRSQMVVWCYTIVKTLEFQKETVEVAMSMVDRYVAATAVNSTPSSSSSPGSNSNIMLDAQSFQLVCMTCLYIAAKVHETLCLTPLQLETLSCQNFTSAQFEQMETKILTTLQWRVHPPTATSFARNLLSLLPQERQEEQRYNNGNDNSSRKAIMALIEAQIEEALGKESFVHIHASSLAFAATMNALQQYFDTTTTCCFSNDEQQQIIIMTWTRLASLSLTFARALKMDPKAYPLALHKLQCKLHSIMNNGIDTDAFYSFLNASTTSSLGQDQNKEPGVMDSLSSSTATTTTTTTPMGHGGADDMDTSSLHDASSTSKHHHHHRGSPRSVVPKPEPMQRC